MNPDDTERIVQEIRGVPAPCPRCASLSAENATLRQRLGDAEQRWAEMQARMPMELDDEALEAFDAVVVELEKGALSTAPAVERQDALAVEHHARCEGRYPVPSTISTPDTLPEAQAMCEALKGDLRELFIDYSNLLAAHNELKISLRARDARTCEKCANRNDQALFAAGTHYCPARNAIMDDDDTCKRFAPREEMA
jgi:hypothetical protein